MSLATLYVTAPSREDAERIAQALLEKRLIACANILDGATSLYWWEGKIERAAEAVLIAKTQMRLVTRAAELIVELHPYDVPCVTAMPILKSHRQYAQWVEAETAQPEDGLV